MRSQLFLLSLALCAVRTAAVLLTHTSTIKRSVVKGVHASLTLLVAAVGSRAASASDAKRDFRDTFPFVTSKDFLAYMLKEARLGDPKDVIEKYDAFADVYPMYKLTPEKIKLLLDCLSKSSGEAREAYNILEIGSFYGYSALNIALNMPPKAELTLIEANAESCEVIGEVLDHALSNRSGIRQRIRLINGLSSNVITGDELQGKKFDFVFMDHDKGSYLKDLRLLEERGLVGKGTVIVADNVIYPGAPEYLSRITGDDLRYESTIVPVPFERIAFETGFKEVADGMAFTTVL